MSNSETTSEAEDFLAGLPCPVPLPTAIEGGIFGMEVSGPIVPDAEDVASITEELAREMAMLLLSIAHLERCHAAGISPDSGRRPHTSVQRERLTARLTKQLSEARNKYELCFDLYEEAFGEADSRQLDQCVRRYCQAISEIESPKQQLGLFG